MEKIIIGFTVNGKKAELSVEPQKTLLDVLRNELNLTGTKCGCNVGDCGACTVILDSKAVNSCMVLAGQVDGADIITIEGLEVNGELDPLQKAFLDNHVIQCGFCTAGMLMSAKALLMKNPDPSNEEIREAISGNLCRCGDYNNVVKAIDSVRRKNGLS